VVSATSQPRCRRQMASHAARPMATASSTTSAICQRAARGRGRCTSGVTYPSPMVSSVGATSTGRS